MCTKVMSGFYYRIAGGAYLSASRCARPFAGGAFGRAICHLIVAGARRNGYPVSMGTLLALLLAGSLPDLAQLNRMIARFAPTQLQVDVAGLSPGDRQALIKL